MTKSKTIRIGTRDSQLALWQAHTVAKEIEKLGHITQIIPIKSIGDLILNKPLYEMGITGIFTKNLDVALLNGDIDIAVHSMKDVPTKLPLNIIQGAVLKRANASDILVFKENLDFLQNENATIATGSLRRKAQWLHRFANHTIEDLRGNVITRLEKLQQNQWNGAIFASAGLDRIAKKPQNHLILEWMTPAPAQGAIVVLTTKNDIFSQQILNEINHKPTEICTNIERRFLRTLEGGCTAPIGAYAKYHNGTIEFVGNLFSICGKKKIEVKKTFEANEIGDLPEQLATFILNHGGKEILSEINNYLKK